MIDQEQFLINFISKMDRSSSALAISSAHTRIRMRWIFGKAKGFLGSFLCGNVQGMNIIHAAHLQGFVKYQVFLLLI